MVQKVIEEINNSSKIGDLIVTEVLPLDIFYVAETYHWDYYARNTEARYCGLVINPKLEKVQSQFANLLKK